MHGLYLYGGVGCGKTMLMDLFVQAAPPEFQVRRLFRFFLFCFRMLMDLFMAAAPPAFQVRVCVFRLPFVVLSVVVLSFWG